MHINIHTELLYIINTTLYLYKYMYTESTFIQQIKKIRLYYNIYIRELLQLIQCLSTFFFFMYEQFLYHLCIIKNLFLNKIFLW